MVGLSCHAVLSKHPCIFLISTHLFTRRQRNELLKVVMNTQAGDTSPPLHHTARLAVTVYMQYMAYRASFSALAPGRFAVLKLLTARLGPEL